MCAATAINATLASVKIAQGSIVEERACQSLRVHRGTARPALGKWLNARRGRHSQQVRPELTIAAHFSTEKLVVFSLNLRRLEGVPRLLRQMRLEDLRQPISKPGRIVETHAGDNGMVPPHFFPSRGIWKFFLESMSSQCSGNVQNPNLREERLHGHRRVGPSPAPQALAPRDFSIECSWNQVGGGAEPSDTRRTAQ